MYAWLLADTSEGRIDVERVIRMLLLHDIVEVDAGDTPLHGASTTDEQFAKEGVAAQRLFGLLPEQQGMEMLALWHEFEQGASEDAQFAKALDRFQPLLTNIYTGGGTWNESNVSQIDVLNRYGPAIKKGAPMLWAIAEQWVNQHFARR
jgi:putative hydrolases of HD superfamily